MKKYWIALLTALLFNPATMAFAATGRSDNSGFVVWVFLGFCALIVVAQLVPALLLMFGIIKGVTEKQPEAAKEKAH